ncbi:MAG: rod shape-determining protein MreC [Methylophilaceae bacterium]|nr:rod shape-determining protein MreC [Methylophilaceae bacterium]
MDNQQPTAFFIHGPSPLARLIFFAALSLSVMMADARLHYLTEIRLGLVALMHPLENLAALPANLYRGMSEYLVTHNTLLKENRRLTLLALQQGVELQSLKTLASENEHLHKLFGAAKLIAQPAKLAEITHTGRDPFTHKVMVNLGARQNIVAGQAVVDQTGVVGQVTLVYPFSSEVTLITDKTLAIPVQIERNGLRAIAFGQGRDGTIGLPYLPANVDIRKGDKLITSGIDGIYPAGLAVAMVIKLESNTDSPFARITCQPVAGVENHFQVLLLSPSSPVVADGRVINENAIKATAPSVSPSKSTIRALPHASH